MAELTNEQLNSLSKGALIILVSSLQDQLSVMQEQLSKANASLADNSIATAPLVASIINGKYSNALPLERQSRTFRMNGIKPPANTLANWVIRSSDPYLSRIYDRLHEKIYENKVLHTDETPVKVRRIGDQRIKGGKETRM